MQCARCPVGSQQRPSRVVDEQLAVADIAGEHGVAGVAGLRSDLERRDARLHGAGGEAGAQAVAGEAGRVDAGGGDALLDDERYGFAGEPLGSDAAMPVDRPEDGAGFDPGNGKPAVEGEDGAVAGSAEGDADLAPRPFLVGLRAPERDDQPLPRRARRRRN